MYKRTGTYTFKDSTLMAVFFSVIYITAMHPIDSMLSEFTSTIGCPLFFNMFFLYTLFHQPLVLPTPPGQISHMSCCPRQPWWNPWLPARGHFSVIEYLIRDKECNPMCTERNGFTPLHYYCFIFWTP